MEICLNVLMYYGGLHVKIQEKDPNTSGKFIKNWISMVFHMKLHIYLFWSVSDVIFHEVFIFQI